jgi:alkanesulfonate monooxygenase SsuD/methylene tetrahydromethanopterin reductase-like flavin-dependent oxidoreductase (luciferase family)
VGIGWNQDEAEDHGVEFKRRRSIAREHVLAMQRLWSDEVASFDGEHVKLPPSWAWPKPARRPTILFGGVASPALFAHVVEFADGWIPLGASGLDASIPELRRGFEAAGRDPRSARVVVTGALPDEGKCARLRAKGVDEAVFFLPSADRETVLPVLDRCAEVARAARAG